MADSLHCLQCDLTVPCTDGIWTFAPGFAPPGFTEDRRAHLAGIEDSHFWFGPRRELVEAVLDQQVGDGLTSAIDLGCGSGALLPALARRAQVVAGLDAYAHSLATARLREPRAVLVQADLDSVPLSDGQFDLVVALDVLEHVEPGGLLSEARRLVGSDGRLLLAVPAFPSLWSPLDEAAGHRCRYRRADLDRELEQHGWSVVHWTHYQALLFPLLWLVRKSGLARLRSVERHPPSWVSYPLGLINSAEVRLLGRRRLGWGSSLVVLARSH